MLGAIKAGYKMIKILREYSEVEQNVFYHTFQSFMNVRFSEYCSAALNSILKNLNLLTKVLPNIASEESDYDYLTKDSATDILNIIRDPVFIARIFLLDKVLYPVSILEKTAQATDFRPFDYVRAKENGFPLIRPHVNTTS